MSKALPQRHLIQGIRAITCEDIRWKYCHIKAITLLPSVLLRHRAAQANATEAILLNGDEVTEGAASNVFVVKDGRVTTPPKDNHILPGITRDLVVKLLHREDIPCMEAPVMRQDLQTADEIWITSTTWEIVPVITLDERPVGSGRPGPVWETANRVYQRFKTGAH
jgi:D-alanine transaminase